MRRPLLAAVGVLRQFEFVPYGTSAPGGTPSISCDGKVPGSTFDATHWTGSETPDDIYADTSTEIALNLARARAAGRYEELDDAIAVNNHFDVDGVLSAWACCDPDAALPHAELLADAAAAGDFGEWPSDDGVKLCLAVEALEDETADEGYSAALAALPGLVEDVDARADLWGDGWESIRDGWEAVGDGGASVDDGAGRIALVYEPAFGRLPAPVVHRALRDLGLEDYCARVLRAAFHCGQWRYEYEKIGHGWVSRLAKRRPAANADGKAVAAALGDGWEAGGSGGLIKICRTARAVDAAPPAVLDALLRADEGARD